MRQTIYIVIRAMGQHLRRLPLEVMAWVGGLVLMASLDPSTGGEASWCLFRWIGIEACPGCGLGHSIAYLARGDLAASFHAHPLGIPAVLILSARCVQLLADPGPSAPEST